MRNTPPQLLIDRTMATQKLTLSVLPRGKPFKNLPTDISLSNSAPTSDIYQQLAQATGQSIHRIRITKGSDSQLVSNSTDIRLEQTGLLDGSKIYVKDLGKTVQPSIRHWLNFDKGLKYHGRRFFLSNTLDPCSYILSSMYYGRTFTKRPVSFRLSLDLPHYKQFHSS